MGVLKVISDKNQDPNFWDNLTLSLHFKFIIEQLPAAKSILDHVLKEGDITIRVTSEHIPFRTQLHNSAHLWSGLSRTIYTGHPKVHSINSEDEYAPMKEIMVMEVLAGLSFAANAALAPQNQPNPLGFQSKDDYVNHMASLEYQSYILGQHLISEFDQYKAGKKSDNMNSALAFRGYKEKLFNLAYNQFHFPSLQETYGNEYDSLEGILKEMVNYLYAFQKDLNSLESIHLHPVASKITALDNAIDSGEKLKHFLQQLELNGVHQIVRGYLQVNAMIDETTKRLEEIKLTLAELLSVAPSTASSLKSESNEASEPAASSGSQTVQTSLSINPYSLFTPTTRIPISIVLGDESANQRSSEVLPAPQTQSSAANDFEDIFLEVDPGCSFFQSSSN